jgi:PAS domain S-box-containing protein
MNQLYADALEASPNLIVGVDQEGRIRLFNEAARATTGYPLENVFGAPFVERLVPDAARPKDEPLIDGLLRGPPMRIVEQSVLQTRTGKVRDIQWTLTRIKDGRPEDVVLFAHGTDTTDALAAARQLRQNERLAAVGTLAAGLAHEIRNPLNGAQLHVSFLRRALEKHLPDPVLLASSGVVADVILLLAKLVSYFLFFARPSQLIKKRIPVRALFSRVTELTAGQVAKSELQIIIDLPPQELFVFGDQGKLQQVLLNLVQNAIEALEAQPSGQVTLRARRNPRQVRIDVEDNGPGIPSPDAPIFDVFFSTKQTGTGLGLAITHRIVSDHGGAISVESKPGRTCFSFTLPIGTDSTTAMDESEAQPPSVRIQRSE